MRLKHWKYSKTKQQEESEIIIDLLKDMEIDFDDLMEEEILEEDEE